MPAKAIVAGPSCAKFQNRKLNGIQLVSSAMGKVADVRMSPEPTQESVNSRIGLILSEVSAFIQFHKHSSILIVTSIHKYIQK